MKISFWESLHQIEASLIATVLQGGCILLEWTVPQFICFCRSSCTYTCAIKSNLHLKAIWETPRLKISFLSRDRLAVNQNKAPRPQRQDTWTRHVYAHAQRLLPRRKLVSLFYWASLEESRFSHLPGYVTSTLDARSNPGSSLNVIEPSQPAEPDLSDLRQLWRFPWSSAHCLSSVDKLFSNDSAGNPAIKPRPQSRGRSEPNY